MTSMINVAKLKHFNSVAEAKFYIFLVKKDARKISVIFFGMSLMELLYWCGLKVMSISKGSK